MSTLNTDIGKRISKLRKEHHMTQEQLAERLDISVKHCSAVERGMASLSLERFIDLCDIFDTSLDYIIRGISFDGLNRLPPSLLEILHDADDTELKILKEYFALYAKIKALPNDKKSGNAF